MYSARRLAEDWPTPKRSDLQNLTIRKTRATSFWVEAFLRLLLGFAKIVATVEVCSHDEA